MLVSIQYLRLVGVGCLGNPINQNLPVAEDSLQACPICQQKMKEEEVFSHLDIHIESDDPKDVIPISPKYESCQSRSYIVD